MSTDVPMGWQTSHAWKTAHLLLPGRYTPTRDGSRKWHTFCGQRLDEIATIDGEGKRRCGQCERRLAK